MLQLNDFNWKEHHENNIQSNPISDLYCIIDLGDSARKYSIVAQYPSKDGIVVDRNVEPECYILFESIGRKANNDDKQTFAYEYTNYEGYIFNRDSFVRVFKTIEEAQERAYAQYRFVFGFALSHIVDDIDAATSKHFSA